ncbi:terpene synthase family protein [Amycolatopsis thermoflava]|uniref:terpene synthase family protein n=1 Tax=Amycolatopsis thermoflava TaxID=84480 RepID=UPI003F49B98D
MATQWTPAVHWLGEQAPDSDVVIRCPFPARRNPHFDRLVVDTERWFVEQGVFSRHPDADRLTRQFLRHQGAEEHARMWPDAEYPGLWLAARLLTHMSCLDDFLDEIWGTDQDDHAAHVVGLIADILNDKADPAAVAAEPLAVLLDSLWTETRSVAPEHWLDRAARIHLAYLETSMEERALRAASAVPTTARYVTSRHYNGGMFYAAALVELANEAWLPEDLSGRPEITDLALRLSNASTWANDLFSYQREAAHGTGANLAVVLTTHEGLTEDEAVTKIVELVNAELLTLDFLCDAAAALPDPAARYADGVRALASGLMHWMAGTARYATTPSA